MALVQVESLEGLNRIVEAAAETEITAISAIGALVGVKVQLQWKLKSNHPQIMMIPVMVSLPVMAFQYLQSEYGAKVLTQMKVVCGFFWILAHPHIWWEIRICFGNMSTCQIPYL
jgi:hypothetical protein